MKTACVFRAHLLYYSACLLALPIPALAASQALFDQFRAGPMAEAKEFIFAARKMNDTDGHWYANIGYYAHDPNRKAWREGAKLYRWDCVTGKLITLLEDPRGGIRDPQLSYDASTILFSYRKGGTENYLLYQINIDGTGLRQLTTGIYDDFEPTHLPNGDIIFVSTRCKRWVNCWLTQVATLHRCDSAGGHIRAISSNNEQDNTPWPMPDGRILYTRWEYVDRRQVDYHHLWVANPDGTAQMNWYGNLHPSIVMIDAKPIPNTDKVVAVFSPGHGWREHAGPITLVDMKAGPDDTSHARKISNDAAYRDPWAFSEDCFMTALDGTLVVMNARGDRQEIFRLPDGDLKAGMHLHEPRPVMPRAKEPIIPERVNLKEPVGRLLLTDVYDGRNMQGIKPGAIKKFLVLETLPMPIHYTGGMDPISYGGTFTLERIVGTVPVEEDGSAYLELPALRSFFFVALDERDFSVKRMQSFLTVQPGETTSCIGCHENRTRTPKSSLTRATPLAARRPPSRVQPIEGMPEVIDFPRDIQPILDELCVKCHGYEKTQAGGPWAGRLILSGDRGPMFSHSYYMLTIAHLVADGRNQPRSNYAPRTLGSSASRLFSFLDPSHGVKASARQLKLLQLWVESGAAYPGTYAALGTGMIGGYAENQEVDTDVEWQTTKEGAAVLANRCAKCHNEPSRLLPTSLSDERGLSFWQPSMLDPRLNTSRHIVFNLSRPEKSLIVLAPLSETAGGWGLCKNPETKEKITVFASKDDPDYRTLLAMCAAGKARLDLVKRFDMPDFHPRKDWIREMKRFGILAKDLTPDALVDIYATERKYWQSLWYTERE